MKRLLAYGTILTAAVGGLWAAKTAEAGDALWLNSSGNGYKEECDTTGLVGARGQRDHQRPRARAEKVPSGSDRVTITTSA
jgi:hypothetical protein